MDGGKNGFRVKPGMTIRAALAAGRIGEGGEDGWGKNGFRVKPGMTMGGRDDNRGAASADG